MPSLQKKKKSGGPPRGHGGIGGRGDSDKRCQAAGLWGSAPAPGSVELRGQSQPQPREALSLGAQPQLQPQMARSLGGVCVSLRGGGGVSPIPGRQEGGVAPTSPAGGGVAVFTSGHPVNARSWTSKSLLKISLMVHV